jgi:hypothetical protein
MSSTNGCAEIIARVSLDGDYRNLRGLFDYYRHTILASRYAMVVFSEALASWRYRGG